MCRLAGFAAATAIVCGVVGPQAAAQRPSTTTFALTIADIQKVETVFKDGVAYDPARLQADAEGRVGALSFASLSWPGLAVLLLLPAVVINRIRRVTRRAGQPAE